MKRWSAVPYMVWSAIFVIVPLFLVLFLSLVSRDGGSYHLTGDHFARFMEPLYLTVFFRSVKLAFFSTVLCILFGYPAALLLSKASDRMRNTLILLFILPMWMNFLLRTYAWMAILGKNGFVNNLLAFLHLPALDLLFNESAVLLGMVYNFLPFMVLPIYTILIKMDKAMLEAAEDLGANRFTTFLRVILPLSLPGVMSGITMVFVPAVSTFVISSLLGGGQYMLIGNLVEQQFLAVGDWHFGSAISMVMMVMILISMWVMSRYESHDEGGTGLW